MKSQVSSTQRLLAPGRQTVLTSVLIGLFLINLLSASLPPAILKPAWQLLLINTFLGQSFLPLLALGILDLTASIHLRDQQVRALLRLYARLGTIASVGFLLLIPLQWFALWQVDDHLAKERDRELAAQERLVSSLRQIVKESRSSAEIFNKLQSLSAPPPPAIYQTMAFPTLQQRMKRDLGDAEIQLQQQRSQASPKSFGKILPISLRNTLLLLIYSLGFAGLAQRQRSKNPLLLVGLKALKRASHGSETDDVHDSKPASRSRPVISSNKM